MSPKELKQLVAICRKSGIVTFKGLGVEFTLSPKTELKVVKSALKQTLPTQVGHSAPAQQVMVQGPNGPEMITLPQPKSAQDNDIPNDSPTAQELLFWSVGGQDSEA